MRHCSFLVSLNLLVISFAGPLAAQLAPPSTGGAAALAHELRMVGHEKRVLMIGAHPDDENTELLTLLTREMGVESAYLALNRGEGGQNLIGSELGEALGLLRTQELLSARQLDGARQYFTRTYDFGFSKTLDDTWQHWPRDSVLKDVVRIIRRFRPQVVVSIFSGTPRDGHGQHQAAGWAAREAFRIAGDSTRFPELQTEEGLAPWTPLKLYRSLWRTDSTGTPLVMNGGALDPAVGQTYHQIAMRSRSRHRSQDMGQLQQIGPSPVRVTLWDDRTGAGAPTFFAGVDTTIASLAAGLPAATQRRADSALTRYGRVVVRMRAATADSTVAALADTAAALLDSAAAVWPGGAAHWPIELADQARHIGRIRAIARGVLFDARADDDRIVAGEPVTIETQAWSGAEADSARVALESSGWRVSGGGGEWTAVPPDSAPSAEPYFMRRPLNGWMYSWPADARAWWGEPFGPPPLTAVLQLPPSNDPAESREVSYRTDDQAQGELRDPLIVVPRVGVAISPDTLVWPIGSGAHSFTVALTNGARDTTRGTVRLIVPDGWPAVAPQNFSFAREDETTTVTFSVRQPARLTAGRYRIGVEAVDQSGRKYTTGVQVVDYPHIRARAFTTPAAVEVVVAPLTLPKVSRIGYIRGAADRVPEALRSIGLPVELLDGQALARGDLSRYDVIVVGPRAYETDRALVANNDRLLAYARAGGHLLVQYQQYQFIRGHFAPYPLTIASPHDRVTDENATVTTVAPSPVLTTPNRIGPDDWAGWI
ncbi:MAG TPA: PIG-L family deacetylase, partial [Gemmatimonadales bacterium]|nr:PIG-L family deacetylase [Gemmatimonadales bacterium]